MSVGKSIYRARSWSRRSALTLLGTGAVSACVSEPPGAAIGSDLNRNGLSLSFSDDFDGPFNRFDHAAGASVLDGSSAGWRTYYPYDPDPDAVTSRTLPGNGEWQWYIDDAWLAKYGNADTAAMKPHEAVNSILRMNAFPIPLSLQSIPANQIEKQKYFSALISSRDWFTQMDGVFEARMLLPSGKGMWPAFWLVAPNPTARDADAFIEIDIMEAWFSSDYGKVNAHIHDWTPRTKHSDGLAIDLPDAISNFHVYAVEIAPDGVRFYIDDKLVWAAPRLRKFVRHYKPTAGFHIIANLAIGSGLYDPSSTWNPPPDPTTSFPQTLQIDWVKVWKRG